MREGEGEGEREQLGEFSKGLCLCEQAERGSVREDMSVPQDRVGNQAEKSEKSSQDSSEQGNRTCGLATGDWLPG